MIKTLRTKVFFIIFLTAIVLFGIVYFALFYIVKPRFVEDDRQRFVDKLQRVEEVMKFDMRNFETKLSDWSSWDDTYKFMNDKNSGFIDSNLKLQTLKNLKINAILFFDTKNKPFYDTNLDLDVSFLNKEFIENKLNLFNEGYAPKSGLMVHDNNLLMYVIRPVLTSEGMGPSMGSIAFVRKIDNEEISEYSDIVHIPLELVFLGNSDHMLKYETNLLGNVFFGTVSLADYKGIHLAQFKSSFPAESVILGEKMSIYFLLTFGFSFVVIVLAESFALDVLIIKRIDNIIGQIVNISNNNNNNNIFLSGNDELNILVNSVNNMNKSLKERSVELNDQKIQIEKSREALMNIMDDLSSRSNELMKFKKALDETSEHVVLTDPDGKVIYANKSVERITGYSRNEIIGNTPRLWGGKMGLDFYKKFWKQIKEDKKPFSGEFTNVRKGGIEYYAYATVSPILDESQNLVGFVGVERDITSQKNYEKNLESTVKQRTSELRASIEAISGGYILFGLQENIIYTNNKLYQICTSIGGEMTMDKIAAKIGDRFDIKKAYQECLFGRDRVYKSDLECDNKIVDIYMSPVWEEKTKEVLGVLVMFTDITERKILERSKDEFFSIASHELRTPLTAIRGNTDLIQQFYNDQIKNPDLKEMIEDIHESLVRLIGIVNDFLSISRLEMKKDLFRTEELDIEELIADVVGEYKNILLQKNVELKFIKSKTKPPKIKGDKDKIKQIIINLIGNAFKFTKKGEIKIYTKINDTFMEIYVQDTGDGISEEGQRLLFRKFQQAGDSLYTRDTSKGTGLGLYISKLLSEGMGGKIWLEKSEAGVGSVFAFSMPIAKRAN